MKNDPIESALARLDEIPIRTPEGKTAFSKALGAKSNLVIAKAARLIGAAQWIELNNEMVSAFDRMIEKGAGLDKGCAAMIAIARALVQLEFDAPDLYLRGIHHIQMEASWGPSVDTAAELRAVCAMGLANGTYPHKLGELVPLLADNESRVRVGAIRAVAVVGNEAASLLLRFKMFTGDGDADVMLDCFTAILSLESSAGIALVAPFAKSRDDEIREAAILAMGASRRKDAAAWLVTEFGNVADPAGRKCILLSLSTSRVEAAIEFLLDLIRTANLPTAALATDALSIHGRDRQTREQVEAATASRSVVSGT